MKWYGLAWLPAAYGAGREDLYLCTEEGDLAWNTEDDVDSSVFNRDVHAALEPWVPSTDEGGGTYIWLEVDV